MEVADMFNKLADWLSGGLEKIGGAIFIGLRMMIFNITSAIYGLLVNVYNLFDELCSTRILDIDIINVMSKRIGVVLGLVMFFYVIFAVIKMMIDPDKISDKEMGAVQIVKKVLMVIFMLAVSTFFFKIMFGLQKKIIDSDVIGRLLVPYEIQGVDKKNEFGNLLSASLLKSFYRIDSTIESENTTLMTGEQSKIDTCELYLELFLDDVFKYNRYDTGRMCLDVSVKVSRVDGKGNQIADEVFLIDFNYFAPIAGGFALYLILMYCFKVGIRMVQLAFLEIISPMAIIGHLSPKKDTMFTKWWKMYIATYIDIFIRIAIIYFVIFLICTIFSSDTAGGNFVFWNYLKELENFDESNIWLFEVVMVLSLLTFAKKVPDLLKELLPSSASKLGFGMSMKDIVGLEKVGKWAPKAATGIVGGALGGAAIGLIGGGLGGLAGGLFKGGLSGLKGQGFAKTWSKAWKDRSKTNAEMAKLRANGGTWGGYTLAKMQHGLGITTAAEYDEQRIADLEAEANLYNTASKEAESEALKNRRNYEIYSSTAGRALTLGDLEKLKEDQTISVADRTKYGYEYDTLLKSATMFNLDYGLAVENGTISFGVDGDFEYFTDSNGNQYNDQNSFDRMGKENRNIVIGNSNATIESNMSKLAGGAVQGRGKHGKTIRNNNNNEVTRLKLSKQYKRNKANNGK